MISLALADVIQASGGRPHAQPPQLMITGVSTDSRNTVAGELFIAIPGPRFDGHDFVSAALQRGAVAAVVSATRLDAVRHALQAANGKQISELILIGVDDPVPALGRLAAYHRCQLSAQVIAVVGSNGKTTTKALIHHILSGKRRGRCSPKSFNNAIGVPLTLLSADAADDYLVVEIGTNAPGEVSALGRIAQPDLVVLSSIGEEHLEGLHDLDGVAAEECSIFKTLRPGGFAAVNVDAAQVRPYLDSVDGPLVTFGRDKSADLRLTLAVYDAPWLNFTLNDRFRYRLPVAGVHNASNAAGAIAIALRLGMQHEEIAARLESFVPPPMRMEIVELGGLTLINDAYNSNPRSAAAAIETLEAFPAIGRRIAVFGEMRELGDRACEMHEQVGRRLAAAQIDRVVLVGAASELMSAGFMDRATGPRMERVASVEECAAHLEKLLHEGDVVLLKASRAVELERLVEPLRRHFARAAVV